ncbi:MAG: hypothetical protein ACOY4K_05825 [Pseudomonadota bacterium]
MFRVVFALLFAIALAPPAPAFAREAAPPAVRDGSHDFDFETGVWATRVRRLQKPLTGSTSWVEYEGTSTIVPLMNGAGNIVDLDIAGPAGRIAGVSLRLFNPDTGQWSLNFAPLGAGALTPPVFGSFRDGRGEFYGADTLGGRAILVRFVISDITPTSAHFEQAFSADGGKTWEVNWIADDTRR